MSAQHQLGGIDHHIDVRAGAQLVGSREDQAARFDACCACVGLGLGEGDQAGAAQDQRGFPGPSARAIRDGAGKAEVVRGGTPIAQNQFASSTRRKVGDAAGTGQAVEGQ